jgi:hypothetical protein
VWIIVASSIEWRAMDSANLWSLDNLSLLDFRDSVDMRPTLLRVLTDLYVQKLTHTPDEKRHYTELALRLLDAVDVTTRLAVATRLGRHLSPPLQVIERLAADLPDVAAAVRAHPLLLARRAQRAPTTAIAPAARAPLPPESDQIDRPPDPAPATPSAAPVAPSAIGPFAHRQPAETKRAELKRNDLGTLAVAATDAITPDVAAELNELFFAASADERRLILLNLHIAAPLPATRVALLKDAAVAHRLESAALARNQEEFAQHLGQALRIQRAQARRIVADDLGEPIVIAGKALAIPRDVLYRILLFVNSTIGHSVSRVHALATLYDEMTLSAAEQLIAIWQALHKDERGTTLAATLPASPPRDEEARARARTATATVRRAPVARRYADRRDAS